MFERPLKKKADISVARTDTTWRWDTSRLFTNPQRRPKSTAMRETVITPAPFSNIMPIITEMRDIWLATEKSRSPALIIIIIPRVTIYLWLRKERYLEQDIKRNRIVYYKKTGAVRVIPSREDSLERLMEDNGRQFFIDQEGVEEAAQHHMDIEALRLAISKLSEEDRRLIYEEFFMETSQEEIGRLLEISQSAVSRRKKRILEKLKKLLSKQDR